MSFDRKKILLISSSTGGHAVPILNVYNKLKSDHDVKILHSGSMIENELFKNTIKTKIICGKLHRHQMVRNIWEGIKINLGLIQSFFMLFFSRPKLIFSKGGFCSVPVLTAARLLKIPYFIHESDIEMGLANKIAAKRAKKVFVAFPKENYKGIPNLVYSGLIIREEFENVKLPKGAKPVIMITGGSQGATKINSTIYEVLKTLNEKFKIYHQVGVNDEGKAKNISEKLENKSDYIYYTFSPEKNIEGLLKSDLIISRASATTIGEIAKLKKASILVPYKYAASDHQTKNAKMLEQKNATVVIDEDQLGGELLLKKIEYLFSNYRNIRTLGDNLYNAVKTNGLDLVVKEIKDYVK